MIPTNLSNNMVREEKKKYFIIKIKPFFFQYGFVNYALELLVIKTFGEEIWETIK